MTKQSQTAYENLTESASDVQKIKPFVKMLSFTLATETYCIDINDIREMIDVGYITKVPLAPDFVVGAMNVRGEITTILNIKKLLGLDFTAGTGDSKILLTDVIGCLVGIWVDSIDGTINVEHDLIQPTLRPIDNSMPGYINGQFQWNNKLFIVLNIKNILSCEKIKILEMPSKTVKSVY